MEGVLAGMTVRYINDSAALDALHERVCATLGERTSTPTWGRHKATWLANVGSYAAGLSKPEVASREERAHLKADLSGTQDALAASEAQRRDLQDRLEKAAAATTAEDRFAALLPADERERFATLVKAADDALRGLEPIVRDAVYYELADGSMPWPDPYEDRYRTDAATEAVHRGDLRENSDDYLVLDRETTVVASAADAVDVLQRMLEGCSAEFDVWFRDAYGGPPDLRRRRVWDKVIL